MCVCMCGWGGGEVGRRGGIRESMGNESSKLMVGFAIYHTRSGQPSRSISPSLQSDLSKRKQADLPGSAWQLGNVSKAKKVPFPEHVHISSTICFETQEL